MHTNLLTKRFGTRDLYQLHVVHVLGFRTNLAPSGTDLFTLRDARTRNTSPSGKKVLYLRPLRGSQVRAREGDKICFPFGMRVRATRPLRGRRCCTYVHEKGTQTQHLCSPKGTRNRCPVTQPEENARGVPEGDATCAPKVRTICAQSEGHVLVSFRLTNCLLR